MARVATVAELEVVLAGGFPGDIVVVGAESVRAGARMMELLDPILTSGRDSDDHDDDHGNDLALVYGVDELSVVASLADYLTELADVTIPALINHPADPDHLRDLNTIGKDIRRAGKALVAYGLAGPGDAGQMATALGNQAHRMTSRAFDWRKAGVPRTAVDREAYLTPRLPGLLLHVNEVLYGARVAFE